MKALLDSKGAEVVTEIVTFMNRGRKASLEEMPLLSFHDYRVRKFTATNTSLELEIDGAYLGAPINRELAAATMRISDWQAARARMFDQTGSVAVEVPLGDAGALKEIDEFHWTPSLLRLGGFSRPTGHWEEIEFLQAKVEVMLEEPSA